MKLQCKDCKAIITEDINQITDVVYIQCPLCQRVFKNPFYEEKDE